MFDSINWQLFFQQFHFIRPLWLLALIPFSFLFYQQWKREAAPSWQTLLPEHLQKALSFGQTGWKSNLPLKLLAVCIFTAVIASAGPTWKQQASPFGEDKAKVLYVLDTSTTMLQKDVPPNRLTRAKQKVQDLLSIRQGGQNALIAYAGSAHLAMPMTQDSAVFTPFLSALEPDVLPVSGKQASTAIPLIDSLLADTLGSSVVLITDSLDSPSLAQLSDYFSTSSHKLIVYSVQAMNGEADYSLQILAKNSSADLVEMTTDHRDIERLDRLVERNMQLGSDTDMPWQDMGYGLMIPVTLMMLLWFRKGWLVKWALVMVLVNPA